MRTLAVDRDRAVYDKPRAIAIDHEILRLFDNLGVAEQLRPYIAPFPASEHFGADGQLIRRIDMVQPALSARLHADHGVHPAAGRGGAARACAILSVSVVVRARHRAPPARRGAGRRYARAARRRGGMRNVTADYVIACDGASSGVRRQLGIGFDDLVFDEPWLVIDLRVNDAGIAQAAAHGGAVLRSGAADHLHRRPRHPPALGDHAAAGRGSARDGAARAGLAAAGALADAG